MVLYVKITFPSLVVCFFFQFLLYMLNINAFDQMWRFILYLYYAFRTLGINNGHSQQCGKRTSQAQVFYTICQPHRTSRPRTCPFPHNTSYKHRILRLTKIQAGSYIYPCNSCISNHQIKSTVHNASSSNLLKGLIDHDQPQGFSPCNPRLRLLIQWCSRSSRPE